MIEQGSSEPKRFRRKSHRTVFLKPGGIITAHESNAEDRHGIASSKPLNDGIGRSQRFNK